MHRISRKFCDDNGLSKANSPVRKRKEVVVSKGAEAYHYSGKPARENVTQFREPRVRYEDVFSNPVVSTVGSDILIIRCWMKAKGLPEIPEKLSVVSFACIAERFLLQRHAWTHFTRKSEAESFLRKWSSILLREVSDLQSTSVEFSPPRGVIPEIAALYSPDSIGLECPGKDARVKRRNHVSKPRRSPVSAIEKKRQHPMSETTNWPERSSIDHTGAF
jgi:hypothetical protein